jgi:hypothetical protein
MFHSFEERTWGWIGKKKGPSRLEQPLFFHVISRWGNDIRSGIRVSRQAMMPDQESTPSPARE